MIRYKRIHDYILLKWRQRRMINDDGNDDCDDDDDDYAPLLERQLNYKQVD